MSKDYIKATRAFVVVLVSLVSAQANACEVRDVTALVYQIYCDNPEKKLGEVLKGLQKSRGEIVSVSADHFKIEWRYLPGGERIPALAWANRYIVVLRVGGR